MDYNHRGFEHDLRYGTEHRHKIKITEGGDRLRKFGNTANKIRAILSVVERGEGIRGRDIASRLTRKGYRVKEGNINMFIYYNMLYKYLSRKKVDGVNHYFVL